VAATALWFLLRKVTRGYLTQESHT
jgi:hypothetical protein